MRTATIDDQAVLTAFGAQTFSDTFASDNTADDMASYLASAFNVEKQLAELRDPKTHTLLGEIDNRLVAYAQLKRGAAPACVAGPEPAELVRFYVERGWHGSGLALELMQAVVDAAKAEGVRTLWLGVWERNPRAIRFYEKNGFIRVGSQEFSLGQDRQTDHVMQRGL